MNEGLLEHVSLRKPRACGQDGVQRFARSAADAGTAGHEDELLAREGLLEASQGSTQFGLLEGPAHVHDGVGDLGRALLSEPAPEPLEALLAAPLDDIEHLGASRAFQGAQERPVMVPFADADLIDAHHGDPVQRPLRLDLGQRLPVDLLDCVAMQAEQEGHSLDRRHLAQLVDEDGQRAGDPGSADIGELQRLGLYAAVGAGDTVARKTQDGLLLPQGEVSQFLPGVVVAAGDATAAAAADVVLARAFQTHAHAAIAPRPASVSTPVTRYP